MTRTIGIPFSGEMVRALRSGRKRMTRRIIKPQPPPETVAAALLPDRHGTVLGLTYEFLAKGQTPVFGPINPPYRPGDHLWVKETLRYDWVKHKWRYAADGKEVVCEDNLPSPDGIPRGVVPARFMPRTAARIGMTCTAVLAERLQFITEHDSKLEGVDNIEDFERVWANLHGPESWSQNPWVWVVSFSEPMHFDALN